VNAYLSDPREDSHKEPHYGPRVTWVEILPDLGRNEFVRVPLATADVDFVGVQGIIAQVLVQHTLDDLPTPGLHSKRTLSGATAFTLRVFLGLACYEVPH
jgi:hypothetical protein